MNIDPNIILVETTTQKAMVRVLVKNRAIKTGAGTSPMYFGPVVWWEPWLGLLSGAGFSMGTPDVGEGRLEECRGHLLHSLSGEGRVARPVAQASSAAEQFRRAEQS